MHGRFQDILYDGTRLVGIDLKSRVLASADVVGRPPPDSPFDWTLLKNQYGDKSYVNSYGGRVYAIDKFNNVFYTSYSAKIINNS